MSIDVKNHPSGVGKFYAAALEGDIQAQFKLGMRLIETPQRDPWIDEYKKGLKWLIEAAENEHPGAQARLSIIYSGGFYNVPKDIGIAIKWGVLAAEYGRYQDQHTLALLYTGGIRTGELTSDSYEEAIKWFKAAAKQGNKKSSRSISVIYRNGWNGKKYPEKAYMFYLLSIKDNKEPHPYQLKLYTKDLSKEQVEKVNKEASNWLVENSVEQ